MIYQIVPSSMILNDHNPDFKGTPLFDVEYLNNGSYDAVLIPTYTRPI